MASDGRYQRTPAALARAWWHAELVATDAEGRPLGPLAAPTNDACRFALGSKEGQRRCVASIAFAHDQARVTGSATHGCHLGFTLVAAAMPNAPGAVVACGVRERTCADEELVTLQARVRELSASSGGEVPAIAGVGLFELARVRDVVTLAAAQATADSEDTPIVRPAKAARLVRAVTALRADEAPPMLGQSLAMLEVQRLVERIALTEATVLVQGESGTGKELVARRLHDRGPRRDRPFVAQNCSALNDNLLESALFGHVRGAFTGATRDVRGLFEEADGGTLFLDEVGDMSPALQPKLLRVLQEGTFTPVGSSEARRCDVRVIAATHKDLGELVEKKFFREDLYYRINVLRIFIPPLREREDDVELLAAHFLRALSKAPRAPRLAPEAMALLRRYSWPGNVRELQNEIERLCVLGGDEAVLGPELVSQRIASGGGERDDRPAGSKAADERTGARAFEASSDPLPKLHDAVEALERSLLAEALKRHHGNRSRVARELGVARSNLILKLARYKLE